VITIGDGAFYQNQLTSIALPNSVASIGMSAFAKNPLTNVSIKEDNPTYVIRDSFLLSIDGKRLVLYFGSEKNVTIPNGVTTIGAGAFSARQLTSVAIPDSVTTIESVAFKGNQFTAIIIPDSVTTIGDRAFEENPIIDITIGADVGLSQGAIVPRFDELYNRGRNSYSYYDPVAGFGQAAGSYVKQGNNWIRRAAE